MATPGEMEELAGIAVDCGFQIHRDLGPGLLESVYEALIAEDLRQYGLYVERQVPVPLVYRSVTIDLAFRADIIVERMLLIELKSVERAAPVTRSKY